MIRCRSCEATRAALARSILWAAAQIDKQTLKLKGADMARKPTKPKRSDYTISKTRSGDEWEILDRKRVAVASGFDDEEEAETWLKNELTLFED